MESVNKDSNKIPESKGGTMVQLFINMTFIPEDSPGLCPSSCMSRGSTSRVKVTARIRPSG